MWKFKKKINPQTYTGKLELVKSKPVLNSVTGSKMYIVNIQWEWELVVVFTLCVAQDKLFNIYRLSFLSLKYRQS